MKIFLTTSHNQSRQVSDLFYQIQNNYNDIVSFIVVESGESVFESKLINHPKFIVLKTDYSSFWAKSNAIGLEYIYSTYAKVIFDLIILNCDVRLNEWVGLHDENRLLTYYTVNNGIVIRSGYTISNWLLGQHYYPFLGENFKRTSNSQVDIVPTRFIFIPRHILRTIWGIIPIFNRLPHYSSDFEFTYRIGKLSGKRWCIDTNTSIAEDYSTTGIKSVSGGFIKRITLLFQKKSVYNIKDRFWYSYLLTNDKMFITRMSYISSSIMKLIIQVFRP